MPEELGPLSYFTHEVGGRLFPGWYRRLPGRRIEVFTRTRVRIEFIEAEPIEAEARRILEELIRLDELPGSDVGHPARRPK
ncbi:MAG TPA: hypothetical protein VMD49_05180 [Steroidobacteraceae bacterium]|nr:hypothetical protein [Steroidobacteraceae bacterium]